MSSEAPKSSVITKEMRDYIGKELEPRVFEIDASSIRKIAKAVGDPNPLWQDRAYAKKTEYGDIIGSPTFVALLKVESMGVLFALDCPLYGILDGGIEIEYGVPIKPGDVITGTVKLADVQERQGKSGSPMLFMIIETTYKNQQGQTAVITRQNFIRR